MKKIENDYMLSQCNILKTSFYQCLNGLEMAAEKNDGKISRKEQKFIDTMKKEYDHLIKVIDKHI